MGLDIYVLKPIKISKGKAQESYNNPEKGIRFYDMNESECLLKFKDDFYVEVEDEVYDWEPVLKKHNILEEDVLSVDSEWITEDDLAFSLKLKNDGELVIMEVDVDKRKVVLEMIPMKEIGYQRKGANSSFYDEGMWNSGFVTDYITLFDHWNKYFSSNTEKPEGTKFELTGFGVETENSEEENRKNFKKNILDKFIDGKTVVLYC